ncbi:hypothetical protein LG329_09520 [Virgibacillus necropolis]|uniref:hypothetical protein n=1 Tax=Virgibacillus necropolis TaxID=163877 RepID=UPI00384E1034
MSMEWFNRVTGELQDNLKSICEKYDQIGHMTIDQSTKHPRIDFFVETEDDERDFFCTILFDPYNEEFYLESFDLDLEQPARIILAESNDVIDAVHESFHDFMNGESEVYYVDENSTEAEYVIEDDGEEYYIGEALDEEHTLEEIVVEWETPEVTAFQIEDEVEVTYQFGIVTNNGDGVLRRVNRVWAEDGELYKDESEFSFTKEEASTIIAMIASNMDTMTGLEDLI